MKIQIYHVQWIPFIRLVLDTVVEIQQVGGTWFPFTESTPNLFQQTDYPCAQWFCYRPVILPSDVRLWSVFPSIISKVLVCRRETPYFSGTMAVCADRLCIFVFKFDIWELLDECCLVLVTSWHLTCLFIFSLILSVCLLIDLVPLNDLVQRMQWM